MMERFATALENLLFRQRRWIILFFVLITLFMAWSMTRLRVDAGFTKLLPMQHEYMQTFSQHQQEFGGANRILIALMAKEGDIFTPEFFNTLAAVTDEVFFIPGVDRTQVTSLFTPNVRFTEVVEDGIAGGNVIPADFEPTPEGLQQVRQNILKAGIVGRLVANDFSGALISVQLQEFNPETGEPINYIQVAHELEHRVRDKYGSNGSGTIDIGIDIHLIGFAKVVGDISDGATKVVIFFLVSFIITALLTLLYSRSGPMTLFLLGCAVAAVIWQLGLLPLLGYGIDPMSVLIPFLIFAIAVSHGVQMISSHNAEVANGCSGEEAARRSFRRLLLPGCIALISDLIGFISIHLIEIRVIQEMAITASLGVAVIILINLILLPLLLSYVRHKGNFTAVLHAREQRLEPLWRTLSAAAAPKPAALIIGISLLLLAVGSWKAADVQIGDLHHGVPELRSDSRYNIDSRVITEKFSIGVDLLTVIVETKPEACIDPRIMGAIDDFAWYVQNLEGVQSVVALPGIAKVINAGWNEGSMKWRVLPGDEDLLAQAVAYVPTSSGLLNNDCSVMPVMIFTLDHKAATISQIVAAIKEYRQQHATEGVTFRLATGNVGVMAATNEEVEKAQFPILIYLFAAVIALCLLTFRSIPVTLCIILPLALVSLLAYALMSLLEIGLKVATLPVVALGVGVGIDYGIYIYSRMQELLKTGISLREAYFQTLSKAGTGVIFTALTLAFGVVTWIFSPLKFQADMGILLTFMFLVNMLGAILLLPALACWFERLRGGRG